MNSRDFSAVIRARGYSAVPEVEKPVGDILGHRHGGTRSNFPTRPEPISMTALIRAERAMRREERLARAREIDGRG